jgi:hypothetical protein
VSDNLFAPVIDLLGMRNDGLAFCLFYPCSQCQKLRHRGFEIEVGAVPSKKERELVSTFVDTKELPSF